MKICAGIVTYNPKIELLEENISAICNQVEKVYLFDNASKNNMEILKISKSFKNVEIFLNESNGGIALALNKLSMVAIKENFEWILTLDQDSICADDLIFRYKNIINKNKNNTTGIITSLIKDKASGQVIGGTSDRHSEYVCVEECITSGALVNLSIYKLIGGYDNKMFIEWVDYDFCKSLIEKKYGILCINYVGLLQEFGTPMKKKLFYKKEAINVYSYAPIRKYYQVRNEIYYARKHNLNLLLHLKNILMRMIRTILQENHRCSKVVAILKGIIVGFIMKIDKPSA